MNVLRTIVHQPVPFLSWAVFCVEKDYGLAKHVQDKFYELSEANNLGIFVEYGTIVSLRNAATVADFEHAVESFYQTTVAQHSREQTRLKKSGQGKQDDRYFFLMLMPDSIRQETFYAAIKSKINSTCPVISQFVSTRTLGRENDRIYLNIVRQINAKLGGDLWRMKFDKEISKKTMLVGIDVCHKGR